MRIQINGMDISVHDIALVTCQDHSKLLREAMRVQHVLAQAAREASKRRLKDATAQYRGRPSPFVQHYR